MGKEAPDLDVGREAGPVYSPVYSTDPADFFYMGRAVPCQKGCPAATNIPAYIRALYEGKYSRSYEINRVANILPAVLGRVCSRPCEDLCRHGERELGQPLGICHIKRAAADYTEPGHAYLEPACSPLFKSVAVIGAGPAGLAAAHDLSTVGFKVTIYEAMEKPGGMLRYGIPEFRLPREMLRREIDGILRLGVEVKYGVRVGQDVTIEELLARHDAVLAAVGCYTALGLGVAGEELPGVLPGLDFMMRVCSGNPPEVGKRALVIGAGFTAFDCARSALRLGAEDVTICLRRTEQELRVTHEEIIETKREGVKFEGLMASRRILGQGKVEGVEFVRTKLSQAGPGGRQEIIPIDGSEFVLPADTVIVATGQRPSPMRLGGAELAVDRKAAANPAVADHPGLYVCGDWVTGPSTVIEAIAAGRTAAERIAQDLAGHMFREKVVRMEDADITDRNRMWDFIPLQKMPMIEPPEARFKDARLEVELGLSKEAAHEEAKRCYLCYLHYEIDLNRCIYCRYCIDVMPRDCIKLVEGLETNELGAVVGYRETTNWAKVAAVVIDNERCIRCGECMRVCPVECISATRVELVERMSHAGGER